MVRWCTALLSFGGVTQSATGSGFVVVQLGDVVLAKVLLGFVVVEFSQARCDNVRVKCCLVRYSIG